MKVRDRMPGFMKSFFAPWFGTNYPRPAGSGDGIAYNAHNPLNGTNHQAVLRLSAVWSCVRLLAETISTLPINLYERMPDGSRRLAPEHALYGLLHNQPNADMTAQTFWEAYVASMLLWGNAFGERKRIGSRVVAIEFLIPWRVSWTKNLDGSRTFRYVSDAGLQRVIPEADMFHTLGFTTDGQMGLSVVRYGSQVFHSALSGDMAANATFDNGLMPTVGFTMEKTLQKDQRTEFRGNFMEYVGGAMNAGKPFLLENGMTAVSIGINPADAQLLESRAWSVEEICRWFRVPPFMVGHSEKSTSWGTGIEQQMIGFLTFSLRPWLTRIEQSVSKNLLGPQRGRYFAEFAIEGLLRADSAGRAAYLSVMTQNGLMTRDEGRAYDNRTPMGGNGAVLTVQSNLVPIDKLGANAAATNAQDALKAFLGITDKEST